MSQKITDYERETVYKIMGMFADMKESYQKLHGKEPSYESGFAFEGFDSNDDFERRFNQITGGINSHAENWNRYKEMLSIYECYPDKKNMTQDEMNKIVYRR